MTQPLLTFVHLSDTHIHLDPAYVGNHVKYGPRPGVAALIDHINTLPFHIDCILHTGDIMTDPTQDADYALAQAMLSRLNFPVYYIPGNHDRSAGVKHIMLAERIAAGLTLAPSEAHSYYTTEVNGVQLIMLDSSVPHAAAGVISDEQLAWLEPLCSDADDARPLIVGVHHHPLRLLAPWLDELPLLNGDALHAVLLKAKRRLRGVFFGHIHETTLLTRDDIRYISTLSAWFQTRTWVGQTEPTQDPVQQPGFNIVTLTATDTLVRAYRIPFNPINPMA
ncbi:MAG: metallophosphoesterase [Armatimonadetes bacterium]|nr:metallophosphoesterase [Anaerolineae bacterium]